MTRAVALSLLILTAAPAAQAPAPDPASAVVVSGRVVAAENDVPLRRARVAVTVGARYLEPVLTDDDGRFVVEIGRTAPASAAAVELPSRSASRRPSQPDTADESQTVTITTTKAGYVFARASMRGREAVRGVQVRLPRGAAIAGRAVDRVGAPVLRSLIAARRLDAEAPSIDSPTQFVTATDDLGEYRLAGLPAGRYIVFAARGGVTIAMTSETVVRGQVAGVSLELRREDAERNLVMRERTRGGTLADASYVPPGTTGHTVVVQPGQETPGVDFVVEESAVYVAGAAGPSPCKWPCPLATPEPVPGMSAVIRGRVTTPSGQPVVSAQVRLSATGQPAPSLKPASGELSFVTPGVPGGEPPRTGRMAYTGDDGRFELGGLAPGEYSLEATKPGYVTARYGQQRGSPQGTTIALRADETVSGLDIELTRGSSVTGTIVDEHGEPIEGALVEALHVRHVVNRTVATRVAERRTDDRGQYRMFGLTPGTYLVAASADAVLSGAAGPRGYAAVFHPGTTDAGGATHVEIDRGVNASGIDLVLRPGFAARVTGLALNGEGDPLIGTVRFSSRWRPGSVALDARLASIAPDGSFALSGVQPGEYEMQALGERGPGRRPEFGVAYVSVADTHPLPVTITTSPGSTLEGRLVIEGAAESARPPVSAFTVAAFSPEADRVAAAGGSASLVLTGSGDFYVLGLIGATGFQLSRAPEGFYLKSVTIDGLDATDRPFDFGTAGGTITGAEIVLSRLGASVSGRALDERGASAPGAAVVVFPLQRDQWTPNSRRLKFSRSAADGSFRVASLPPGEYWVAAADRLDGTPTSGEWQAPDVLESLTSAARRVTLGEGEQLTTDLRVTVR